MLHYILLLFLIGILPLAFGKLMYDIINQGESKWMLIVYGWIILFALFEIVSVPLILLNKSLSLLCVVYTSVLLMGYIVLCYIRRLSKRKKTWKIEKKSYGKLEFFIMGCAVAIIIFQVIYVVWNTHMDADDTFYIGHAVTALNTDKMYRFSPYTGAALESIPINYVLSPLSMFWAFLSKLSGVHPAIIAHIFIPIIFIPMSYIVVYSISIKIFGSSKTDVGLFLLLYAILQQYGYVSVYTASTFLLFRIWQGKAMLANIFLPMLFLMAENFLRERKGKWLQVFLVSLSICCCSSMGVVLGAIEMFVLTLVYAISEKKISIIWKGIILCLPYIFCGGMYVMMKI